MWKLILLIIVVIFGVIFIGFNLGNVCTVSVIFHTFENVPVFMPILISLALGIIVVLPFLFTKKSSSKKVKSQKQGSSEPVQEASSSSKTENSKKSEKNVFFRSSKISESPVVTPIYGNSEGTEASNSTSDSDKK